MSNVQITNSVLQGEVTIPPSKSAAHRAMICSYLAGEGTVNPIIDSSDMKAMKQVLKALENNESILDCIESGNTSKFIIPVAAALGRNVTITGSGSLLKRPIDEYLKILPKHGIKCTCEGSLPLTIEGKLIPGIFEVAGNISSQYITGLLLALPLLEDDSKIILTTELQSKPYVDMTIKVLKDYSIEIQEIENGYYVKGKQEYKKQNYIVEGDWSQAAFFLAGGVISGDIILKGIDINSAQGDKEFVNILKKFGAYIEIKNESIHVKKSNLKAIEVDVSNTPDIVPALAVVASFAKGTTRITGTERLKYKESNRIESIVTNLSKLGIKVQEKENEIIIEGGKIKQANLDGYNDHRIVMAFAIAAVNAKGVTTITDVEAIKKTYPHFFEDYNKLGGKANVINNMQ